MNFCYTIQYWKETILENLFCFVFQSLTDAVIGFVESNGRFFIMDMWTTGYLQPILESSQDLSNMEGVVEDGFTTLKFTRPRNTNDNQDIAFSDDKGLLKERKRNERRKEMII